MTSIRCFPVLCLILSLAITAAAQHFDYSQLVITSISSDTCQDVYPYAWNCSLPSWLTFTIAGLPASPPTTLVVLFDGSDAETYTMATYSSNSTYVGSVEIGGYALGLMGRTLTVTVFDSVSGNHSHPFNGLSFVVLPFPVLTSISGCQGSGTGTYLCVPDRDVLHFSGTGLSVFNAINSYQFFIGTSYASVTTASGSALQVVDDTSAYLFLNNSYASLLDSQSYSGVVMSVYFNLRWWQISTQTQANFYTESFNVSFAPISPPQAFPSSTTCTQLNSSIFTNCAPQQGTITFTGQYLLEVSVSLSAPGLGIWICNWSSGSSSRLIVNLPVISVDRTGLAWDLTITAFSGSLVFPGLVTFSTAPNIVGINICSQTSYIGSPTPNCLPGSTITITGTHFPADPLLSIGLTRKGSLTGSPPAVTTMCMQPEVVDEYTITCVLPLLNASLAQIFYGSLISLSVLTTNTSSNSFASYLIAAPDAPVLTSVSGCAANNGSLQLLGCRGGDVIVVHGSNLNGSFATTTVGTMSLYWTYIGGCTVLPGGTSNTVQCELPYVDATNSLALEGVQYSVQWYISTSILGSFKFGNAFYITFTWDVPSAPTSSSSSSSHTTAILAGVLVPVLVLLAAFVAWMVWRMKVAKAGSPRAGTMSTEDQLGQRSSWTQMVSRGAVRE